MKPISGTTTYYEVDYGGDKCLIIDRKQYEEDLKRRQKEHLDKIHENQNTNWRPCLHDACPECLGTGVRRDGGMCVHGISCPCPRCTPSF